MTISPCMDEYDRLLSEYAAREGWDEEEQRAIVCRYFDTVHRAVTNAEAGCAIPTLEQHLQAESRKGKGKEVEQAGDRSDFLRRATLAYDIHNLVKSHSESFEYDDMIGPDLAYLLGAILNDTQCEWLEDRPLMRLLQDHCPYADSPVWKHIILEKVPPPESKLPTPLECHLLDLLRRIHDALSPGSMRDPRTLGEADKCLNGTPKDGELFKCIYRNSPDRSTAAHWRMLIKRALELSIDS